MTATIIIVPRFPPENYGIYDEHETHVNILILTRRYFTVFHTQFTGKLGNV